MSKRVCVVQGPIEVLVQKVVVFDLPGQEARCCRLKERRDDVGCY